MTDSAPETEAGAEIGPLRLSANRLFLLLSFAAATVLLIAVHRYWIGSFFWLIAAFTAWRDPEKAIRRRIGMLLICIAILAATDINTSTSNANFLQVGIPFFLVIFVPAMVLARTDPGVIRYRFFPRKVRKIDVFYTVLSIPLAWAVLKFYWWVNPDLYTHWPMPPLPDAGEIRRLFVGINLVGIWDELFFVNIVFAVLRSLFSFRVANSVQAVVYTSVLFDMAFTGIGPVIVFIFAWTQGSMFEKSEGLLWVLLVHLIVDFFLVAAIVSSHYPDYGFDFLWRHGL